MRNLAEALVDFIEDGIVMQTIGQGRPRLDAVPAVAVHLRLPLQPPEIIPIFCRCRPRPAWPSRSFLALIVWVIFIAVGIKHQGLGGYLKSIAASRPACRRPLYILVTPIEFISTFLVRPFSLAVRLFANMLAGHILLVTFAILTDALITRQTKQCPAQADLRPALRMLIFLTAFEVLVGFLQAYIFTILAAVYIGGAPAPRALTRPSHRPPPPDHRRQPAAHGSS